MMYTSTSTVIEADYADSLKWAIRNNGAIDPDECLRSFVYMDVAESKCECDFLGLALDRN